VRPDRFHARAYNNRILDIKSLGPDIRLTIRPD